MGMRTRDHPVRDTLCEVLLRHAEQHHAQQDWHDDDAHVELGYVVPVVKRRGHVNERRSGALEYVDTL